MAWDPNADISQLKQRLESIFSEVEEKETSGETIKKLSETDKTIQSMLSQGNAFAFCKTELTQIHTDIEKFLKYEQESSDSFNKWRELMNKGEKQQAFAYLKGLGDRVSELDDGRIRSLHSIVSTVNSIQPFIQSKTATSTAAAGNIPSPVLSSSNAIEDSALTFDDSQSPAILKEDKPKIERFTSGPSDAEIDMPIAEANIKTYENYTQIPKDFYNFDHGPMDQNAAEKLLNEPGKFLVRYDQITKKVTFSAFDGQKFHHVGIRNTDKVPEGVQRLCEFYKSNKAVLKSVKPINY